MIKILNTGTDSPEEIFARSSAVYDVSETVAQIIADVRQNGDGALLRYAEEFDKAKLDSLEVTQQEFDEAFDSVEPEFIGILEEAAANIRDFHSHQVKNSFIISEKDGIITGQKVTSIAKVGLYVPGGTAAYPSTVLMDSVPAKIAGCEEICITTPPMKNGKVNPAILAAAKIAGVDRVFKAGGAQAIAALAYGTESVPKVDKIVGPGNAFVAEAKRQVFGLVDIDMIAGPSEILVIADDTADPKFAAADLMSQAEHDVLASAIMVTTSEKLADATLAEIERQKQYLSRKDIISKSLEDYGAIIIADSREKCVELANRIAPEHLEVLMENPFELLGSLDNAGSIFLGNYASEPLGDYYAGPNHVLPTNGTAKFFSPLGVDAYVKKSSIIYYSREGRSQAG